MRGRRDGRGEGGAGLGSIYLMSSSAEASMPASLSIWIPSENFSRGARPSGILKLPASGYSRWMTDIQYWQRDWRPLKMKMRRASAKSMISSQLSWISISKSRPVN